MEPAAPVTSTTLSLISRITFSLPKVIGLRPNRSSILMSWIWLEVIFPSTHLSKDGMDFTMMLSESPCSIISFWRSSLRLGMAKIITSISNFLMNSGVMAILGEYTLIVLIWDLARFGSSSTKALTLNFEFVSWFKARISMVPPSPAP